MENGRGEDRTGENRKEKRGEGEEQQQNDYDSTARSLEDLSKGKYDLVELFEAVLVSVGKTTPWDDFGN
ncbi:unnamed protein product [Toxocara canis]|uniref:Uncharacterized protein n=1 Tax=Toxocara canis TaxID=6265 RepID=A0A183VC95_TOXCA|nr:unnamed protein product [Toxocara canis]